MCRNARKPAATSTRIALQYITPTVPRRPELHRLGSHCLYSSFSLSLPGSDSSHNEIAHPPRSYDRGMGYDVAASYDDSGRVPQCNVININEMSQEVLAVTSGNTGAEGRISVSRA
ncbi:hypothetical protein ZHAS_00002054 [Anopheles sinensis]|uniref:Uncharacterized protein n=1 Tax=Anopheles sinensis TaxID=74873 RepID=A0A084VBR6_ANOSI|nr:hypothetical protein ZHAS_00002054 [Anopheles sinensis]